MATPFSKPGPVRTAQKYTDFMTDGAIARALLTKFPDVKWTVSARSLAAKIGNLDKGKIVWWVNHSSNAECLAELLDTSLADLGLHGPNISTHIFSFDDFPELPPLDLKQGTVWALGEGQLDSTQKDPNGLGRDTLEEWLAPARWSQRPPYKMNWLHVADDLERQLLSKSLKAISNFEVVFVEALADVGSRLLGQKPLIVSVRADGGEEDIAALASRPENAGTLVIAPFMLPIRKETSSVEYLGWERRTARGQGLDNFELTAPGRLVFGKGVTRWTWKLFPDWRTRLLKWVEGQVSRHGADSLFSEQRMNKWLDRFDPSGEWFCTTTDMLQLCRMGHYSGTKFPEPTDIAAGKKLAASLFSKKNPSLSLQVEQLAEARWQRRELPWQGALPLETWLSLSPTSISIITRDDLNGIAQGNNLQKRKKAVDYLANRLEAGNPNALLASGLIKQDRRGYFDFQHRTLAGLVVRDSLMQQIIGEPLASWALACFDDERRPMVDAALDAVSIKDLVGVSERLNQEAPDSAAAIGASEALFMTVARRIGRREVISPALMPIALCVLDRLDLTTVDWLLSKPWTRPSESQDEQLEWITACWAWSLLPEAPMKMSKNWLFPGWCESLEAPPYWLTTLWPDKDCEQLSTAWVSFFYIVDQWLKELEQPFVDAPRILKIGLLAQAARGAWLAEHAWWQELIDFDHRAWMYEILLKPVEFGKADVAVRLWPSFLEFERNASNDIVRFSQVRSWLLGHLNPSDALSLLDEVGRLYLATVPESLPPEFRQLLLSSLPEDLLGIDYDDALPFFRRFGPSAAPALISYLDHDILGHAAATCLWDWQPESTALLLEQNKKFSTAALCRLVLSCPASHLTAAVELLLAEPTLLEPWECLPWARKHLTKAGIQAECLLEIITALPSNKL